MATTINGWVVKTQEYQESSRLIYVMTDSGVVSFLARGVRKFNAPLRSLLEPFQWIEATISGKGLPALKEAKRTHASQSLSLEARAYLQHLAELFYTLRETIPFQTLLPYFQSSYDAVIQDCERQSMMVELKLLYLLGVHPVFDRCVICDSETRIGFSIQEGGMVCQTHQTPDLITDQSLIVSMYQLYSAPPGQDLPEIDPAALRRFLDQYYAYHVHVQTTARQWIQEIFHY